MNIIKIPDVNPVKLTVNISSDANVGSNISINDEVVKKSIQNEFSIEHNSVSDIYNKVLSVVSNFFVQDGNIDAIMNATYVSYAIKYEDIIQEFTGEKVKINPVLFMVYFVAKIEKKE